MANAFSTIVGNLDYPMFVATTIGSGGERAGCLVGFATQASIDPSRFLVCVSDKNRTYRVLEGANALALHVVPEDAEDVVELFGGETADDTDKFDQCEWREGPEGLPILERCPSWFAGRILERHRLGDHVGHLVEPFAGEAEYEGRAYPFSRAKRIDPGHEA
ncbi:MAG TPA: flavin reductase family protein [Thermoleophilaceae bacterium]|jgi:flavin reductase (DIM6/NTAB) family NADH-FMN oxidoreductase RutF